MAILDDGTLSFRIPGRLCSAPSDLGIAFPHGGTDLGHIAEVVYRPQVDGREIKGEEFGGETIEYIEVGHNALLAVFFRGLNSEATQLVFPRGTPTNIPYPASIVPGRLRSADAVVILFSPRDTVNHPAIILYNAMPRMDLVAELNFGVDEELGVPALFQGIRDGSNRVSDKALLVNLSL